MLLIILAFTLAACNRGDTDKSKSDSIKDSNGESGSARVENDKEISKEAVDDYELMMSYINQIKEEDTEENVREIMGEPDYIEGSEIDHLIQRILSNWQSALNYPKLNFRCTSVKENKIFKLFSARM